MYAFTHCAFIHSIPLEGIFTLHYKEWEYETYPEWWKVYTGKILLLSLHPGKSFSVLQFVGDSGLCDIKDLLPAGRIWGMRGFTLRAHTLPPSSTPGSLFCVCLVLTAESFSQTPKVQICQDSVVWCILFYVSHCQIQPRCCFLTIW